MRLRYCDSLSGRDTLQVKLLAGGVNIIQQVFHLSMYAIALQ